MAQFFCVSNQGEAGAGGPKGSRGPQGSRGESGMQGPQGEAGLQGTPGNDGASGEKGTSVSLTIFQNDNIHKRLLRNGAILSHSELHS